jgi:hypothetical protein
LTIARSRSAALATMATAVLLLLAAAAFVRGWIHADMQAKVPWTPEGAGRALALSAGYWAVFIALALTGRRALPLKLALAAAFAVAYSTGPLPVLATAFLFASAAALGSGILSRNGATQLAPAELPLCIALGLGIIGSALSVLALWPVNSPLTYFLLLALPLAWQGRAVLQMLSVALRGSDSLPGIVDLAVIGVAGNLALLSVAMALLPEVSNDGLAFHLLIAAHVRDFGYWHYDVQRNVLAVMPIAVDFLYAAGYMFGGEMAARLVNAAAFIAVLALVHVTVRAIAGLRIAAFAVALAAASPLAMVESSGLFVDNAWSLLLVGSTVLFLRFLQGADPIHLIAGGAAIGAALAIKLITVAAFPAIALILLLALREPGRAFPWKAFGIAVAAGLLLALPPYVIALAKTGNPVFPFFNAIFRSPLYPPQNAPSYLGYGSPLLLYWMTFHSDRYLEALPGAFGFTFLLLLPPMLVAAFAWGRREGGVMLVAAVSFAAIVVLNIAYLRYLYPCVFLFAIAFGITLARAGESARGLRAALVATATLSIAANVLFLTASFAPTRDYVLAAAIDAPTRHAYITKWAHWRHFVPVLNGLPDQDLGVAFLGGPSFLAELRRPAFAEGGYVLQLRGRAHGLRSRDDLLKLIADFNLGYLMLDASLERQLRAHVVGVATPLASFSGSTLYRIDHRGRFPVERLAGPRMEIEPGAWNMHGTVPRDPQTGVVLVDHDHVLWQRVPIVGGRPYRYAVQARCHREPAEVRLQVIWHRPDGSTSLSFRNVGCLPDWIEEESVFTAPPDAVHAVVFATGHGKEKVEVRGVSFRSKLVAP